jgi:hypothetical protein
MAQPEKGYLIQERSSLLSGAWTPLKSVTPSSVARLIELRFASNPSGNPTLSRFFQAVLRE